jgi:hypothetical protein
MPIRKAVHKIRNEALQKVNNYWLEDASFLVLLLILCFLVFLLPILQEFRPEMIYINYGVFIFLYFSGIFSSYNPKVKIFLAIIFLLYLILKFYRLALGNPSYYIPELSISLISLVAMIGNNIILLFRDEEVTIYRIIGAVNVYLLLSVYGAVFLLLLNQFFFPVLEGNISLKGNDSDFPEFIYYSLTSLTTVGFGEIYSNNVIVRQLSVFLSTFGMLYPALVISKLLNIYKK